MPRRVWVGVLLVMLLGVGCTLRAGDPTPASLTAAAPTATASDPGATPVSPPATPAGSFGPVIGGAARPTPTPAPATDAPAPADDAAPPASFGPVIGDGAAPTPTPPPGPPPSDRRFTLRDDAVRFQAHPDGCNILAVAGQVYDAAGASMAGQHRVHVWNDALDLSAAVGSDPRWGAAGYQIVLADQPQAMTLRLQLLDLATGAAASDVFRVQTLARCEANHLIADFVPASPD